MSKRQTNGLLGIVAILAVGLMLVFLVMLAAAAEKSSATGGSAISADTAQGAPGAAFTSLSGPKLLEEETGEFTLGSIVLNAPAGFQFNAAQDVTISFSGEDCNSSKGIDLGSGRGVTTAITPTESSVTLNVTAMSTGSSKCRLTYSNLQVRPTAGTPLASGSLTYSGTSSVTGSAGTLTEVAGTISAYQITGSASVTAGSSTTLTLQIVDRAGNRISSSTTKNLTFSGIAAAPSGAVSTVTEPSISTGRERPPNNVDFGAEASIRFSSGTATTVLKAYRAGTFLVALTDGEFSTEGPGGQPLAITVGAAALKNIVIGTQPGNGEVGHSLSTAPSVYVRDVYNNIRTDDNASLISAAIEDNPAGGTLAGTKIVSVSGGLATFTDLSIDRTGVGYTLQFTTSPAKNNPVSNTFDITSTTASQLGVLSQPSGASGGAVFLGQPRVAVQDHDGNTLLTNSSNVTVSLGAGPGTLSGTTTVAAVGGIATFTNLRIDNAGAGYVLHFSDGSLTPVDSAPFSVVVGPAAKLAIQTQPAGAVDDEPLITQPVILVQDAGGNTVTTDASTVTASIQTNPVGGTVSGSVTAVAVNGVATFSGLVLEDAGVGYVLRFSDGALSTVDSVPFNVTVGAPFKLAIQTQPGGATGGSPFAVQPVVAVQDDDHNLITSDTSNVTVSLFSGSGTLSGTTTVSAVGGIATFTNLRIDNAGGGYVLRFTDGALQVVDSDPFTVGVGGPVGLAVQTEPASAADDLPFATQPVIRIRDAGGNTVSGATNEVTVTILTNPAGGTLAGTTTVAAVDGIATFTDLSIDNDGTGYVLRFDAAGLAGVNTDPFTVTENIGPAAQLSVQAQPSGATGGSPFSGQPAVAIQDEEGDTVLTNGSNVTVSLGAGPGTLSGTTTVAAVGGIATFTNLRIDNAGAGYVLHFSDGSLTPVDSAPFSVVVGPAAKLAIQTQPAGAVDDEPLITQPVILVQDAGGNTVTTDASTVTASIQTNPVGGTVSGSVTAVAVNGVATFSGLVLEDAGVGYVLRFSDGALSTVDSVPFNVTVGAPFKLAIQTQPGGATGGSPFAVQPVVAVQDDDHNLITSDTSNVTVSLFSGSGTLSGTTTVSAVGGIATFTNLRIDNAGGGYVLRFTDGALQVVDSDPFTVGVGSPVGLAIQTEPPGAIAATPFEFQPVIRIRDAGGNTVSNATNEVTVTILTNPAGGTLAGTTTVAAVDGVATFTDLSIDHAGTGYVLNFDADGLESTETDGFNVDRGPAAKLGFISPPGGATGGTPFSTQPILVVLDAGGNVVDDDSGNVSVSLTGPGTLSGATIVAAVGGIATFTDLGIDYAADGYVLHFSSPGLTGIDVQVNVQVGPAASLEILVQPGNAVAGKAFGVQPVILMKDAGGNTVLADTSTVSVVVQANPGGASLIGATAITAIGGVATYHGLALSSPGMDYVLHFTDGSLTPVNSLPFSVDPRPSSLDSTVVSSPGTVPADGVTAATITVTIRDAEGAEVSGETVALTQVLMGGGTSHALIAPLSAVSNSEGIAQFLVINTVVETVAFTATTGSVEIEQTASVEFTPIPVGPPAAPAVGSISPNTALAGTTVTIYGTGFLGATAVYFGDVSVPFTIVSDSEITAISPSAADGSVMHVRVITAYGTSPETQADEFADAAFGPAELSYSLHMRWTLIVWTGPSGTDIGDAALGGMSRGLNGNLGHISAVWTWDASLESYRWWFPSVAPGDNTLSEFTNGGVYWVEIVGADESNWRAIIAD